MMFRKAKTRRANCAADRGRMPYRKGRLRRSNRRRGGVNVISPRVVPNVTVDIKTGSFVTADMAGDVTSSLVQDSVVFGKKSRCFLSDTEAELWELPRL